MAYDEEVDNAGRGDMEKALITMCLFFIAFLVLGIVSGWFLRMQYEDNVIISYIDAACGKGDQDNGPRLSNGPDGSRIFEGP